MAKELSLSTQSHGASIRSIFDPCLASRKLKMVLLQKPVSPVDWNLSGAKNGNAIGTTLSIALRSASQNDNANPLHSF
jgi:hypothetical protein